MPANPRRSRYLLVAVCPVLMALLVGCGKQEPVVSYHVPKPDAIFAANHVELHAPKAEQQATPAGPERLIAALLSQPNATYIFKVKHAQAEVDAIAAEIHELLDGLTVDVAGAPHWTLPEGWTEQANENGFGGYRIIHAGRDRVPIAVSKLSAGQDVLLNVNRWLAQVGLPDVTKDQLDAEHGVERIDVDGTEMLVVDVVGTPPGGAGGPPFAGMGGAGARPPSPHGNTPPQVSPHGGGMVPSATPQNPTKFAYITPEGWKPAAATGIRLLSFEVANGGEEKGGEVKLFRLAGNPSFLVDTLNQWRAELKLDPLKPGADLATFGSPIEMDGIEGAFVDLSATGDADDRDALLGAIFVTDENSWVVKFTGPSDLLDRETEHFRTFVESLRILPNGEAESEPADEPRPDATETESPKPTEPSSTVPESNAAKSNEAKSNNAKPDEPQPTESNAKPDAPATQPGGDAQATSEPQPESAAGPEASSADAVDNGDTPAEDDRDGE